MNRSTRADGPPDTTTTTDTAHHGRRVRAPNGHDPLRLPDLIAGRSPGAEHPPPGRDVVDQADDARGEYLRDEVRDGEPHQRLYADHGQHQYPRHEAQVA